MEQIIVSIYIQDKGYSCDLELPSDIEIKILVKLIINALKLDGGKYTILKNDQTGEVLQENTTLGEKGLWTGSILKLE